MRSLHRHQASSPGVVVRAPAVRARFAAASTVWPALMLALSSVVAFTWILHSQLQRLYGLTAPSWDLGQSQQVLWSLANGHGWASSFEGGKNFLGIHVEPIFLPIAVIERIWPHPAVPLVLSAIGLAATAPAGFLMLRALLPDRPRAVWLALALAAPIPFWAATQEAARDQFHPENLALAVAMLAAWAGLTGRTRLLWLLVLVVLACKEDQSYTAFVIGAVLVAAGTTAIKRQGKAVMVACVVWLVAAVAAQQLVRGGGGYSPQLSYYWWIWQEPGHNFLLRSVLRPDPWLALAGLLAGLLGLPLLAPRRLIFVVPPLAANLLSSHDPQGRLQLHYVLLIMFPMIVAAGFGARRLLELRLIPMRLPDAALLAGAVPALIIGLAAGHLPPALGADGWLYTRAAAADRLLEATAVIPPGAPVYADDGAAVWLSDRILIGQIPASLGPDRYIVIDRLDWSQRGDAATAALIARMPASGRRLLADDGRFQVWSPSAP